MLQMIIMVVAEIITIISPFFDGTTLCANLLSVMRRNPDLIFKQAAGSVDPERNSKRLRFPKRKNRQSQLDTILFNHLLNQPTRCFGLPGHTIIPRRQWHLH